MPKKNETYQELVDRVIRAEAVSIEDMVDALVPWPEMEGAPQNDRTTIEKARKELTEQFCKAAKNGELGPMRTIK